jgi:transposase
MATILALDLGKFKSVACWYELGSGAVAFETVPSARAELQDLLTRRAVEIVVFEACTLAGWLHDLCLELGLKPLVANTNGEAWRFKNLKRKTDRDDALKLARLTAMGDIQGVRLPAKATREKRALLGYRQTLVTRRVQIQNRIRSVLLAQGLAAPRGHRAWTELGLEGLGQLARPLAECGPEELWRGELGLALTELGQVLGLLEAVENKLDALNKEDENVQRLQTIPGVGPRTAETVAAYLDEAQRFKRGGEVSSYAGFVPRLYESGQTSRRGRITKRGPRLLRKMLVECAWVMLRYNAWARRIVARISKGQKVRRKQAVVALARKLLVRMWAMLRDRTAWRDEEPQPRPQPAA